MLWSMCKRLLQEQPKSTVTDKCNNNNTHSGGIDSPPPYESAVADHKDQPDSWLDLTQIQQTMTLMQIAADMSATNQAMALDLYMMALDRMVSALPIDTDPEAKAKVESQLADIQRRYHLPEAQKKKHDTPTTNSLSDYVVAFAVMCAVTLKKSPIPGLISWWFACMLWCAQTLDETWHIRQTAWHWMSRGAKQIIAIDQRYRIHHMLTSAIYTTIVAFIRAGIAYAEAPGYQSQKSSWK